MKPIRLHLKNYRKFEDAEIEFQSGITGIIGRNGAGKSSVVEALEWSLYGKNVGRGDNKENIRRAGADYSEECLVEFEFELKGESYLIKRWLRGKNSTAGAELISSGSGTVLATGPKDVETAVNKILGMDYQAFEVSVFAKQSELAALSSMGGTVRRETILRLLGIKKVDKVVESVRKDEDAIKKRINLEESFVKDPRTGEDLLKKRKKELDATIDEIESAEEEKRDLLGRREKLDKRRAALDERIRTLEDRRKRSSELNSRLTALREKAAATEGDIERIAGEISGLQQKRKSLEKLEGDVKREEEVREAYEAMSADYRKHIEVEGFKRELAALEGEMEALNQRIQRLRKSAGTPEVLERELGEKEGKKRQSEDAISEVQDEINSLDSRLKGIRSRIEEVRSEKERIDELGEESECPTCHRPLEGHYAVLMSDFERKIASLEEEEKEVGKKLSSLRDKLADERKKRAALEKGIERLKERLQEARRNGKELDEREEELRQKSRKKEEIVEKIASYGPVNYDEDEMKRLKDELKRLEAAVREYNSLSVEVGRIPVLEREREEAGARLAQYLKEIEELKQTISEIGYSEEDYAAAQKESRGLNEELRTVEKEIGLAAGRLKTALYKKEETEKAISALKEKKKELAALREEAEYVSKAKSLLEEFRKQLIQRIRPELSDISSSLLREITEGKYTVVDFDEDYKIRVMDDGILYPIERFSGGEKDLINLCVRLAISKAAMTFSGGSEMNTIILDEVFSSQDEERKRNILNALKRLSRDFSHIIAISHMYDVKESVDRLIRVEEDPETGTSYLLTDE